MSVCRICLRAMSGDADYHPNCMRNLFGTSTLPHFDLELDELYALAAEMAGKMSISGVQAKVLLKLSDNGSRLEIAATGGCYILKPRQTGFPALPENEHLTMRLATLVEIETPPNGLLQLKDGTLAYVIKRFDRIDGNQKLAVEDFCQLSGISARGKYESSAESCVRLLRKYADEPLVEIRKLYRLMLFSWWAANGDLHLKNLSLLTQSDGRHQLSPAYDLVNTMLVIPGDTLALPVGGKRSKLTRRSWLNFASYCGLPAKAAETLLSEQIEALEPAVQMVNASPLPAEMRLKYEEILGANTTILKGAS